MYSVRYLKNILSFIRPHLEEDHLITQKKADSLLFRSAAWLFKEKQHLYLEGGQEIINIKASRNRGCTSSLFKSFPRSIPALRTVVSLESLDHDGVAGFTSGDGSFGVFMNSQENVTLRLTRAQDAKEEVLINYFKTFFGCGHVYRNKTTLDYRIITFRHINQIIIPLFMRYKILGIKDLDLMDWVKIAEIITQIKHTSK